MELDYNPYSEPYRPGRSIRLSEKEKTRHLEQITWYNELIVMLSTQPCVQAKERQTPWS